MPAMARADLTDWDFNDVIWYNAYQGPNERRCYCRKPQKGNAGRWAYFIRVSQRATRNAEWRNVYIRNMGKDRERQWMFHAGFTQGTKAEVKSKRAKRLNTLNPIGLPLEQWRPCSEGLENASCWAVAGPRNPCRESDEVLRAKAFYGELVTARARRRWKPEA